MSDKALLQTERLLLRPFTEDDADFVLELVHSPAFREQHGEKGVHTREDARRYIQRELATRHDERGFGLYCVERRAGGECIGLCGLVCPPDHSHANLRFALLERHRSQGYALEATRELLRFAGRNLKVEFSFALLSPGNTSCRDLLTRLGFRFERELPLPGEEPVHLYVPGESDP
ncbi:MAG: GNAT family N-acetyltransferase [Gammaproteobacteria bacterium]|nr:GNAT family N-acetyltransferase [Gammaproteobacteria bacterium]